MPQKYSVGQQGQPQATVTVLKICESKESECSSNHNFWNAQEGELRRFGQGEKPRGSCEFGEHGLGDPQARVNSG